MSSDYHVTASNFTRLGQRFISCSCGEKMSGGEYDGVAQANFEHHRAAAQMLTAVRKHAEKHYNEGWDVIVEAYEDEELAALIAEAPGTALNVVIEHIGGVVEVVHEIRSERQRPPLAGWHY